MSKLLVFDIRKEKYAGSLKASGVANRWNKNEEYVIYSGSSPALSVLELTAHRAFINIDESYKILVIELAISEADILEISVEDLPENWRSVSAYPVLQNLGSKWYQSMEKLILKIPSALVPKEFNYLINTQHPDFRRKVKIKSKEDFNWDERLI
ncbi:RES family NAD+ phosphorylase [Moheibacter sp.]|uniref:RES family NAD+ phosphorylase n=1 Tax=Moheibacter sp. TaxID=1965316 RepID=UPI003C7309FE